MMSQSALKIVYGGETSIRDLCDGFNRGFSDYKYGSFFDPAGMERFMERAGIERDDCAVLLARADHGWQGVGTALLAVEGEESWCGGLAVAPEYRRRHGAHDLMLSIQQQAYRRGARRLWLEVLAENQGARALYQQLGYVQTRELLMWERSHKLSNLPDPGVALQPVTPTILIADLHHWHDDCPPAWQRRAPYLRRAHSLMDGYTIPAEDGQPAAYLLSHHNLYGRNGREIVHLFDVAVDPGVDASTVGSSLLQALQLTYQSADLLLVNEPAESKLNPILAALGFSVVDRQYEMVRSLQEIGE